MRTAIILALMLVAPVLLADHHHIASDETVNFEAIKTFLIREGSATTTRPELNNKLIIKKVENAIRAQLLQKGLTEDPNRADAVVSFRVGQDRRNGPRTIFDKGTLLIDITKRDTNNTIWQGTYTHEESNPAKVAEQLGNRVQKLFSEFPPKKKK